jgi:hypothetical protein
VQDLAPAGAHTPSSREPRQNKAAQRRLISDAIGELLVLRYLLFKARCLRFHAWCRTKLTRTPVKRLGLSAGKEILSILSKPGWLG